jgi:hypothetical protein
MNHDPLEKPAEPGAYVGHEPERQAETIPGGVRPDDERIAAHSTQREEDPDAADASLTSEEGGADASLTSEEGGHREQRADDSQGES